MERKWPVMSEQYPLLNEESDEDKYSPRYQRRRPVNSRGHAKYHMKGAAAIMTRWPEHWTSILTYWWMGLGMIALTTFIMYNILFSISLIQPTDTRPVKNFKTITHTVRATSPPGVFMHVFANDKDEENVNKYLPYIEVFANKYKDITYNLIIATNDTNLETNNLSDETNNNIALNSLWATNVNYGNVIPINTNIKVKYINLSTYLNESPLKKYWTSLPHQFIHFLVRTVSVWDKGGIAVNPDILIPHSPHAAYAEKLVKIIKNFKLNNAKPILKKKLETPVNNHKNISPRFNNIQDIINALETEEVITDLDKEILHAEESQKNLIESQKEIRMSVVKQEEETNARQGKFFDKNAVLGSTESYKQDQSIDTKENKSDASSFLPSFMDYLFHRTTKSPGRVNHFARKRSSKIDDATNVVENTDLQMRNFWPDIKSTDNYKPMIVSAKGITNETATATNKTAKNNQEIEKIFDLTVDLKGNIIATETPCHAFIGTIFTNAIHHDVSESLTDFIITELSSYCKGLLASCVGIDVILV